MRLVGLGGDGDVGAVARRAKRDRKPDAARGAGDEERLAGEGSCVSSRSASLRIVEEASAPLMTLVLKAPRAEHDVLGEEAAQRDPSRMRGPSSPPAIEPAAASAISASAAPPGASANRRR